MRKLFLLITVCALSMAAIAQNKVIKGLVIDAGNNEPLIGASIMPVGAGNGTATDIDGSFSLSIPESVKMITVSYVGMQTKKVEAKDGMTVKLASADTKLDEVVVTGYGVAQKSAYTGAAAVVGENIVTSKTDANVMKSLQGSVAGLQMNNSTGMPGAEATVVIRGVGSYSSNTQPLYVVDGTPMFSEADALSAKDGQYYSPISNINPSDIESITVLKDASATAIYGARAANGVIVIETKKGSGNKLNINLNLKKGWTQISPIDEKYKPVNDKKWLDIWGTGIANAGIMDKASADKYVLGMANQMGYRGENTNWLDAILRSGNVDEYSVDFSGKTGETNYFISGGYYNNEGIIINTGMERFTGRFNLSTKYRWISLGVNASGAFAESNGIPTSSAFTNPLVTVYGMVTPIEPIYNTDGTYNSSAYFNPIALNDPDQGDIRSQKVTTATVNPWISVDFGKGFVWKTNFALNYYHLDEYQFWSVMNPQGAESNGVGQKYNDTKTNLIVTNTLNWLHTFGDYHDLNIMLGQEAQKTKDYYEYYAAQNFAKGFREMSTASEPTKATDLTSYRTIASFFANANYSYAGKYFLSGSARYDGCSAFGDNTKWGLFGSVGAKWRMSEEKFWENIKPYVNNIALRASYGTVGNCEIGWYSARGLYDIGYNYAGRPGMRPTSVPNKDLGWESRHKFDVGIDATILNRVVLAIDFYNERTKDLLYDMPISQTTGLSSIIKNIGEMENMGVEVSVNANIFRMKDFSWDVNFNITANKNKMIKLSNNESIEGGVTMITPGKPLHTYYMKEYAGVDPENGSPLWYKADGTTTSNYGEANKRFMGSADPKAFGGFGTTLRYKGFDLSGTFAYQFGGKVYGTGLNYDLQTGDQIFSNVMNHVYDNAWTENNRHTDVPKFVYGDASGANKASSRFLMSSDYLRMKSLTFGYTLPHSIVNKIYLSNVRAYFTADNLFTVKADDFIGFDPEAKSNGAQAWQYPVAQTFAFGLNISF